MVRRFSRGPDQPVVALTIRYDRIDNFWFVLMHELIHISRHLNADLTAFYDDLDVEDKTSIQEQEADDLAGRGTNSLGGMEEKSGEQAAYA